MSTIKVLVNEQSLRVINGPKIASRGVNENVVEFTFDESWDGFGKTAIFYKEFHEENVYQSIIDSDGIASVPHEVTDTECKMCFGVVGTKGNIIYTTEVIKYNIVKGVPISGSESEPPSPTIYQQMLSLVGQVQSDVDSFESDTNDRLDVMSSQMDEFIAEHAGTYGETVLWDSDNASGETISGNTQTVTLAEDCSEYDYIDIHFGDYVRTNTGADFVGNTQKFFEPDYDNKQVQLLKWQFGPASNDPDGIHFKITYHSTSWSWSGNAIDDAEVFGLSHIGWPFDKIVGRKLVADAELVDARVGVDGTVYQTVGAAIRGQINDVVGGTIELDTTLTQQGKAADSKAVGDKISEIKADLGDITVQKVSGNNILPPDSVSGYWDTETGLPVDNLYMTRSVDKITVHSGTIYVVTRNGFNGAKITILFLSENGTVLSTKTFSSSGSLSIPTNATAIKVYINGLSITLADVCVSYTSVQYEAYSATCTIDPQSLPDDYYNTIEAIEEEIGSVGNKTDRIAYDISSFEPVGIITQETAQYTNGMWQANGTIATTTAALRYNAIDLIDVIPGATYLLTRIYGFYLLYDSEGKNGIQSDIWTSYQNIIFTVPVGKTKIGINVSTTHFPSSFAFSRITPVASDYSSLKTAVKILNGQKIVNFGDSIFGNFRADVGEDMSISAMLNVLTGATNYNAGFGGCRMGTHPTTYWDAFSMYRLAYSIATSDWAFQDQAIIDGASELPSYFVETLEMLKSIDWTNIDAITIGYGTNDFTGNITESDFKTALSDSISTILTAYPHLKFVIISPMYRWYANGSYEYTDDSDTHRNSNNNLLTDFCDWCENIARIYHVPYCDTYTELGINSINRLQYFVYTDGTHPNVRGRWMRAKKIADAMCNTI